MSTNKFIDSAKKTIEIQADSIASLSNQIDKSFAEIGKKVSLLKGKLIVMGVGKSGHVGQKVSATLASTLEHLLFLFIQLKQLMVTLE